MVSFSQQKLLIFKVTFLFWKDVGCIKKLQEHRALKSTEHFCISFIQPPLILTSYIRLQGTSHSVAQSCLTLRTSCTVAYQAPPSMGFSGQEYRSGLLFPTPGDLPDPGIELASPAVAGRFFTTVPPGKPYKIHMSKLKHPHWHSLFTCCQLNCKPYISLVFPLIVSFWSRTQSRLLCCIWSSGLLGLLLSVSFFSLASFFTALIILKSTGQVFCWKPPDLGSSDIFSWLDWGYRVREEDCRAGVPSASFHTGGPWWPVMSQSMLILVTWVRCYLPSLSTLKLSMSPFPALSFVSKSPSPAHTHGEGIHHEWSSEWKWWVEVSKKLLILISFILLS